MTTPTLPPPPPPPHPGPPPVPPARGSSSPHGQRGRRAWRVVGSLVAAGTLLWGTAQVVAQLAHEEEVVEVTYDASAVTSVDARVDNGRIRIVASTGDTVRVTARVSRGLRATGHRQELDGGQLVLRGECSELLNNFCNVDYTVEVPASVSVVARTDNDDITLTGIDGAVDAATDNGAATLEGGRSPKVRLRSDNGPVRAVGVRPAVVDASTSNGSVRLELLVPPEDVQARSDNGDVDVVVPDDPTTYQVDASSGNGDRSVVVRTDPTSDRHIEAHSENGDVTVRYPV
jgi:hypothetical protein